MSKKWEFADVATRFTGTTALQFADELTFRRVLDATDTFAIRWAEWTYELNDGSRVGLPLPRGWLTKVRGLALLGATEDDLTAAVDVAMNRASVELQERVFPYALGVVWQRLISRDSEPGEQWGGTPGEVNGRSRIPAADAIPSRLAAP